MNDELKLNAARADGFDGDGATEGDFIRVIQGEKWSFSNEGTWVNADEELISPDREVVVIDIVRVLQKWIDQTPVREATRFLAPGEQVDIEQLNEACPKSEWSEDLNGKLRGPWQLQNVVYMVDLQTMQRSTYPTSTVGGSIAISDLRDAVRLMRRFKGPGIYPVVSLGAKHMNTRFGGRQRPHFVIKRWVALGGEGALPPIEPPPALSGPQTVEPPTAKEALNDEIIF